MVNRKRIIAAAVTLLSLGISSLAVAVTRPVSPTEVPRAVVEAVSARYPAAQGVQFAREMGHGKTVYAVRLAVAGAPTQLCVAQSGGIEREQQAVAPATLPAPVQQSLVASGFKSAEVVAAQRTTRSGQLAIYELVVAFAGSEHQVTFDAQGELVTAPTSGSCVGEPGATSDRVASAPTAPATSTTQTSA